MTVLGVEYGCKYVLKAADGTRAVFNDSTDKDFVGILGPESSGLDSADVREDATDAVEEDGGHHGDFYDGRRPVVLAGTIIASSATDRNEKAAKIKRASRALREDAVLTWQPLGGVEVELKLRRQQPLRVTKGYVKDFQIPMVAASAFIEATVLNEKSITTKTTEKKEPTGSNESGVGTIAWTNPTNVKLSDNIYATTALGSNAVSNYLVFKSLGFAVPESAHIVDVRMILENKQPSKALDGNIVTNIFKLTHKSLVFTDEAEKLSASSPWNNEERKTEFSFGNGGAGSQLTPVAVNDASFGARLSVKEEKTISEAAEANVDNAIFIVEYSEAITLENKGSADAACTIKCVGRIIDPIFTNETTGESIVLNGAVAEGKTLEIDFKAHTIKIDGVNAYNMLVFSESSWWKLAPGVNKISGPKSTITWKDTYI